LSNDAHGAEIADRVGDDCFRKGGQSKISREAVAAIRAVPSSSISRGSRSPSRSRRGSSARAAHLVHAKSIAMVQRAKCARDITDIRRVILKIARL
jgi:hypothetical protein